MNDLFDFEKHLHKSLKPVHLDPEFVGHLRRRLVERPLIVVETRRQNSQKGITLTGIAILAIFLTLFFLYIQGKKKGSHPKNQ